MVKLNFNLEPKDALEYLKNKGYKLTFDYTQMQKEAHHKAFTVAKITRIDLLHDVFDSIFDAINTGKNFKDFQKDIKPTLQKKGWWGEQEIVNPVTGEVKTIKVDSRRLRNIYKTNLRVAYSTQRYKSQMQLPNSKYLRYISALLENTRDSHEAAHGTILINTHSWWDTHYPPNGFGCVCKVRAYSLKQIQKNGWTISQELEENFASKEWKFNPAKIEKVSKLEKIDLNESLAALPNILKNDKYKDLTDEEVKDRFFKDLDVVPGQTYIDKVNDPIIIDDSLFKSLNYSKATKRDRHLYIDQFSQLIKDPDEIYLELEDLRNESDKYYSKGTRLIKKYMKYYKTQNGAKKALMALFEYQKDKTQGVSLYFVDSSGTVEKKRITKLIYQRDQSKN